MNLVNCTIRSTRVWPDKNRHKRRRRSAITMVVLHRTHLNDTLEEDVDQFEGEDLGTGRQYPYHFRIARNGVVKQALGLSIWANGAMGINKVALHVALEGDFREEPPTMEQLEALEALLLDLTGYIGACSIYGHTEIPDSSTDPLKECPGRHLDVDRIRKSVGADFARFVRDGLDAAMEKRGYVL